MKHLIIFAAFFAHSALAALPSWYSGPMMPRPAIPMYSPPVAKKPANDASACYAIADPDARTMCRAELYRDPSICYAITNPDNRALCRARAAR